MNENQTEADRNALNVFVESAKQNGMTDDTVVAFLRAEGWSERNGYRALAAWYRMRFDVHVPKRSSRGERARDAFYYVVNFVTLGSWATALGQLLDTFIWRAYPTGSDLVTEPLAQAIAWPVALVAVNLPVFLYVQRTLRHEMQRRPDLAESPVRLWLCYLALAITAAIILGDSAWALQTYLRGALTTRFVLESLVIFTIGGSVFASYFTALRHQPSEQESGPASVRC